MSRFRVHTKRLKHLKRNSAIFCKTHKTQTENLYTFYLLDSFDSTKLFDESVEFGGVVNHNDEISSEQSVVTVDVDAAKYKFLVL